MKWCFKGYDKDEGLVPLTDLVGKELDEIDAARVKYSKIRAKYITKPKGTFKRINRR